MQGNLNPRAIHSDVRFRSAPIRARKTRGTDSNRFSADLPLQDLRKLRRKRQQSREAVALSQYHYQIRLSIDPIRRLNRGQTSRTFKDEALPNIGLQ